MTERVLIANRGEIAVRIVRACRDLGLTVIAVYGPGDDSALHVRMADEAYRIESDRAIPYLDIPALIAIACRAKAHLVHPGYGFLAENATFAEECARAGLFFVGPPAGAIATMGDKVAARASAVAAGVPILPGTTQPVADAEAARAWAAGVGYPVVLKAAAGGGGRGFRIAERAEDLPGAFVSAQSEAERSFGDGRLYAERYLMRPRHVEVQVFADQQGHVIAIGDRDCSIQRRHQKLIEESPAPNVPDSVREQMADAAIRLARGVGYVSAGTLEFLVEPDGRFSFLEMNTRIQVEHTVTEEVHGVDLVREQLLVALGEPLSIAPHSNPRGHAVQCRINAEDPGMGFAPTPGRVTRFVPPLGPGIRVDTAVESGSVISERYDSMIAKLVATGPSREIAIARMRRALDEIVIEGVPSTIPLHRNVMASSAFQDARLSTSFLMDIAEVIPPPADHDKVEIPDSDAWTERTIEVNGRRFHVRVPGSPGPGTVHATARPKRASRQPSMTITAGGPKFASPIQGSVLRIHKGVGDVVAIGDPVMVVEAMKMENELRAQRDGVLIEIPVSIGASVKVGDHLFTVDTPEELEPDNALISFCRYGRQSICVPRGVCKGQRYQPGQDSLCHGLPARIEHAVVGDVRDDLRARVVRLCRGFDLAGSQHVISPSAEDEQRCLDLFGLGSIKRDHVQKCQLGFVLHLVPIRQQIIVRHILRKERLARQLGGGDHRYQAEGQVDFCEGEWLPPGNPQRCPDEPGRGWRRQKHSCRNLPILQILLDDESAVGPHVDSGLPIGVHHNNSPRPVVRIPLQVPCPGAGGRSHPEALRAGDGCSRAAAFLTQRFRPEVGYDGAVYPREVAINVGGRANANEHHRVGVCRRDPDPYLSKQIGSVQPAGPRRSEISGYSRQRRSRGGELVNVGRGEAPFPLGKVGPKDRSATAQEDQCDHGHEHSCQKFGDPAPWPNPRCIQMRVMPRSWHSRTTDSVTAGVVVITTASTPPGIDLKSR